MSQNFKKRKVLIFLSAILGVTIALICLNYFFVMTESKRINDNTFAGVDRVLVGRKMNYEVEKCLMIEDKEKIKELCSSIKWESKHLGDDEYCDYCIIFIKGDKAVYVMPIHKNGWFDYNLRAFLCAKNLAKEYKNMEESKLNTSYVAVTPINNDYGALKTKLINNFGFKTYSHYDPDYYAKKPYITLTYTTSNPDKQSDFEDAHNLGEFAPDNRCFW